MASTYAISPDPIPNTSHSQLSNSMKLSITHSPEEEKKKNSFLIMATETQVVHGHVCRIGINQCLLQCDFKTPIPTWPHVSGNQLFSDFHSTTY